ncbi:MAG: MlaD family protein [Phycisphaerae bacterium]|nr:MlaD family protein [Phycisphaerae bacterium]
MREQKRNVTVGVFAILGLVLFGWMVFKFGDLPNYLSQVDAREVVIHFPDVAGIGEGATVLFRGYSVGRIIKVNPPMPMTDKKDPSRVTYQSAVEVSLSKEYPIPDNVIPTIFKRGLGSSYIDLVLRGTVIGEPLVVGAILTGVMSEGSEFLSEKTQSKLDNLVDGVNQLTVSLQNQLKPRLPDEVDSHTDVNPNLATAIVRLDNVLRSLEVYLGDPENQQHFKKTLSEFAALGGEVRTLVSKLDVLAQEAGTLVEHTTRTVDTIGQTATQVHSSVEDIGKTIQTVADAMATDLKRLGIIFQNTSEGKGTMGRLLNDPRLYETLTDTSERLGQAIDELKGLAAHWQEEGVKMKLK